MEQAVQKEWLVGQHLEIWGSAGEERAVYIPGLSLEMEGREWIRWFRECVARARRKG